MSRGDSEHPKFDDLDFSNLEPIDGDSVKKSPKAAGKQPEAAADATGEHSAELDFAPAAEPGESLSGMFAAMDEESVAPVAEPAEVTADAGSAPGEVSADHSGIDFGAAETPADGASGMSFGESNVSLGSSGGDVLFGDDPAAGEELGVASGEGGEAASEEESEPKQGKVAATLAWLGESNPFTVLLGIAFGALLFACLLLVIELCRYDFTMKKESIKERVIQGPAAAIRVEQPLDGIRSVRV